MMTRSFSPISLSIVLAVCLFVMPDVTFAVAPEGAMPAQLAKDLDTQIYLDLREMDVVDVYKFLSLRGNFNISISKLIAGRVTLHLKNVSIKDALDIISIANGLAYRVMGEDIIYVMTEAEYQAMFGKRFNDKRVVRIFHLNYIKPAYVLETLKNIKSDIGRIVIDEDTGSVVVIDIAEYTDEMEETIKKLDFPLELHIYDLKYANAEEVVMKLKERIDNKSVGSTQADVRSNQVIVRAFPDRLKEAEQIIAALDKKNKAVLINVRILKVVIKPQFDVGIDWQTIFGGFDDLTLKSSFPISGTVSTVGTLGQIAVGDINRDNFSASLSALKQISNTKVLANPSIMVLNNEQAKIHIGDKLAYVTTTTIGTGESQQVNEEIHYIDVGVQFVVTPTINDDGYVKMKIRPEISSKSDELETSQGSKVPLINTTAVETSVMVKDGNTIIIGGLRQDELAETQKGIPGLQNVPVIGGLFRNKSETEQKTEIVILLTPQIVSGEENYVDDHHAGPHQGIRPYKEY